MNMLQHSQNYTTWALSGVGLADLTFGRSSAHYWQLIAYLAIVSIVLWLLVIVTTLIRFTVHLAWYWRQKVRSHQPTPGRS